MMSATRTVKLVCIIFGFMSVTTLVGCKSPYALRTSAIKYDAKQIAGSIRFTDPKLYKREALINERNAESTYLQNLLDHSDTIQFGPEILRELQTVSSLSAALGLRFDPASAINFKRSRETSDLQQEIQTVKLQLQLDQLKRDAELFREGLKTQQTPVNQSLGNASASAPPTLNSGLDAPSAAQLTKAISDLQKSLSAAMTTGATALTMPSAIVTSPVDQFLDRAAYRNMINSAKNAVSLDELHDKNGAALVRLSFSATTLPPPHDYRATLGLLRMKVSEPIWTEDVLQKLYMDWLDHVNNNLNISSDDPAINGDDQNFVKIENPEMMGLRVIGDLFDVAYYHYDKNDKNDKQNATDKKVVKKVIDKKSKNEGTDTEETAFQCEGNKKDISINKGTDTRETGLQCEGISFEEQPKRPERCATLILAVPRLLGNYTFASEKNETDRKAETIFKKLQDELKLNGSECFIKQFSNAQGVLLHNKNNLLKKTAVVKEQCDFDLKSPIWQQVARGKTEKSVIHFHEVLRKSFQLYWLSQQFSAMELQAKRLLNKTQPIAREKELDDFRKATGGAGNLIAAFMEHASNERKACQFKASFFVPSFVPPRFRDEVKAPGRVAVYEVGPREQVQQLSTVARASEAIGLAAAISGQIPMYAIGVDGNVDYSRSAIGKADALERVPLVISFTEPGTLQEKGNGVTQDLPAFGWLLGPKMSLDPKKQKLVLEQQLKPYDLSVDLSVPGWWPYLILDTTTAWAPNWQEGDGSTIEQIAPPRKIKVNLSPNAADFSALTNSLRGTSSIRRVSIDNVAPHQISACATDMVLEITGESVWRASTVLIGGRKFDGKEITVMPDMRGVLVSINNARFPVPSDTNEKIALKTGTNLRRKNSVPSDTNPSDTNKISVTILTPYGTGRYKIGLKDAKPDGSCKSDGGSKSDVQISSNNNTSTITKTSLAEKPAPDTKTNAGTKATQSAKSAP